MKTVKATTGAVACTLTESEQRARREELRGGLRGLVITARETADGFALGFAPESIDVVREFVAFESRCCGFLTYAIDDSEGGRTWLHLSGPEGAKEFVRGWLPVRILEKVTS